MQFDRNVLPSPVFPVNNKFFSFISSKLVIKLFTISLIFNIFSRGEISLLYFSLLILSEYKFKLKFSKFSLSKLYILLLLYKELVNCCF